VVTGRDFTRAAESIFLVEETPPEEAYERFVAYLLASALIQRTHPPVRVFVGLFGYFGETEQEVLWKSDDGLTIRAAGFIPVEEEHSPDHDHGDKFPISITARRAAYFRFEGRCSSLAFRRFRRQACSVLRYACRSYQLIKSHDRIPPRFAGVIDFGDHIRAFFSTAGKKDSVERRLRNAIHLGVQSDRQRHNAIGLALSVAVVEALLCIKGENIATMFAENTASLLEPDPHFRSDAAAFLKHIYDARSKVLHGDTLEHDRELRTHARTIAGAVIQAVIERRDFLRRMDGKSETPDDLIKELRVGKWTPGQLTGVSESPVRRLWGAPFEGTAPDPDEDE
jgi:hypothetical protein